MSDRNTAVDSANNHSAATDSSSQGSGTDSGSGDTVVEKIVKTDDPPKALPEPTRLQQSSGVLTLLTFLALAALSILPDYTLSPTIAVLLFLSFLTFLGFGQFVGQLAEAWRGR